MRSCVLLLMAIVAAHGEDAVPNGVPVSQPLQTVVEPSRPVQPDIPADIPCRPIRPERWSSYELLLWWSKVPPIPALATASRGAGAPLLGGQDTISLVGGSSLGDRLAAGFRFTLGWQILQINGEDQIGFEFSGLFLDTVVSQTAFSDNLQGRVTSIGRPYLDATTGLPASLIVSGPNSNGSISIASTTRVQGWEVNLTHTFIDAGDVTVSALAGYRYFLLNEGLHVQQSSLRFPGPGLPANVLWTLYDQFDGRNNYHGAQLGLRIDSIVGRWLFGFSGKVAYGANFQTVQIRGGSSAATAALPLPAVRQFPAGMLATSTNMGRGLDTAAAVLPEGRLNFAYRVGDNCHLFAGYDFIYLSSAVRPGDQVDLAIDPSRSPILNNGQALGPNRPQTPFARSDFWVQGVTLGLDYRY